MSDKKIRILNEDYNNILKSDFIPNKKGIFKNNSRKIISNKIKIHFHY